VTGVNDRVSRGWIEYKVGRVFVIGVFVSKGRFWLKDKKSYALIKRMEVLRKIDRGEKG